MKPPPPASGKAVGIALGLCAAAGFGISLFLLIHPLLDPDVAIPGCGGGSCAAVLGSRWAKAAGLPVALPGALTYLLLLLSLLPRLRRMTLPVSSLILGAGLWFTFVQAVILRSFCPWCCALHVCGLAAFLLMLVRSTSRIATLPWLAAGTLSVGLAQVYGPLPATTVRDLAGNAPSAPAADVSGGRVISFDGGRMRFAIADHPLLGKPDAKHVLVEYFDYLCPACATMAGHLEELVAKHPDDVAVLLLPVPLERTCNPHVEAAEEHEGSCEVARLAMDVFHNDPASFPAFDHALMKSPSVETARRLAGGIPSANASPAIRANIAGWHALSRSSRKLPKLLIRDRRILHGLPSGREDFIRVMEQELGL